MVVNAYPDGIVVQAPRPEKLSRRPNYQDASLYWVPWGGYGYDSDKARKMTYGKGVLTPAVLGRLCRSPRDVRVLVDPKGTDYSRYRGASIITPNRAEAETATGLQLSDAATTSAAAQPSPTPKP